MKRPHEGRVVFLGDAAHATSPQLGQGANLALMDARSLAKHVPDLDAHARDRHAHTRFYQYASRWLTPMFQSDRIWLGPVRDLLVPIGSRIPWFRKHALAAMAGTKSGWFSMIPLRTGK